MDRPTTKTLVIDLDDFNPSYEVDCLPILETIIEDKPGIKISLFSVPRYNNISITSNPIWIKDTKKLIESNNICLAVHGYNHTTLEFGALHKYQAISLLRAAELEFDKATLPYVKVFKGPHWGMNDQVIDALIDLKYTHVYTHPDSPFTYRTGIRAVPYTWNLKDEYIDNGSELVVAHGHTHNVCDNGIKQVYSKIYNFIEKYNPIFKFVYEV